MADDPGLSCAECIATLIVFFVLVCLVLGAILC